MRIPISHMVVEKLISMLEACYSDNVNIDTELWADFNLVAIARDLMDGDYHREGDTIDITDQTACWLETITVDSDDDDMQLIASSLNLSFSVR